MPVVIGDRLNAVRRGFGQPTRITPARATTQPPSSAPSRACRGPCGERVARRKLLPCQTVPAPAVLNDRLFTRRHHPLPKHPCRCRWRSGTPSTPSLTSRNCSPTSSSLGGRGLSQPRRLARKTPPRLVTRVARLKDVRRRVQPLTNRPRRPQPQPLDGPPRIVRAELRPNETPVSARAITPVVPEPRNGSSTKSPALLEQRITRSR